MQLTTEDLEELRGRFSRLETDIEAFSEVLSRVSNARLGAASTRRLSSSRPSQEKNRMRGETVRVSSDELFGAPIGTGWLGPVVVVGSIAAAVVLWTMRLQKVSRGSCLVSILGW